MAAIENPIKLTVRARAVDLLRRPFDAFRFAWLRIAARSTMAARLHYLLFSPAFAREMRVVIAGHVAFEENRRGAERVNYFLRRCIHRLEKGLIMRPRREVFALDFIEAAVSAYRTSYRSLDEEERHWAHDVLGAYFGTVGRHPVVDRARQIFESCVDPELTRPRELFIPAPRSEAQPSTVSHAALMELSLRRRSVRWYQQRSVPRQLIDEALEVARLAPSACNRQPFEYRIFDDPETLSIVTSLPPGIAGYTANIPAIAVLVGRLRAYPEPRDRHVIYIDGGLSAMAFMYALETLGLSSCPINWPDIPEREERISTALGLAADERVIMMISIGYAEPDGLVPNSRKLSLEALRSYNRLSSNGAVSSPSSHRAGD